MKERKIVGGVGGEEMGREVVRSRIPNPNLLVLSVVSVYFNAATARKGGGVLRPRHGTDSISTNKKI